MSGLPSAFLADLRDAYAVDSLSQAGLTVSPAQCGIMAVRLDEVYEQVAALEAFAQAHGHLSGVCDPAVRAADERQAQVRASLANARGNVVPLAFYRTVAEGDEVTGGAA